MADDDLKNDAYWQDKLSPDEFRICREGGTERAFSGEYYTLDETGMYRCRCCEEPLFTSEAKYDSGSGWPSFYQPAERTLVSEHLDKTLGMTRTEITCSKCDAHLGHVFTDGPAPTGLRYCVNSASLRFEKSQIK